MEPQTQTWLGAPGGFPTAVLVADHTTAQNEYNWNPDHEYQQVDLCFSHHPVVVTCQIYNPVISGDDGDLARWIYPTLHAWQCTYRCQFQLAIGHCYKNDNVCWTWAAPSRDIASIEISVSNKDEICELRGKQCYLSRYIHVDNGIAITMPLNAIKWLFNNSSKWQTWEK